MSVDFSVRSRAHALDNCALSWVGDALFRLNGFVEVL